MKSRTSFFNTTVLRKDITRYAPVWGLYAIGLFLILFVPNIGWGPEDAAEVLLESLNAIAPVNAILGIICALTVFGDLFKTRLCYATHALPLRREGWFLTHYTAGILFSFVPNLMLAGLFCILLRSYWYIAALWLAVATLSYLFFFGTASFTAACAGNRLGAAAGYLILNFFALLISWYAEEIYTPLLYGIEFRGDFLELLMPASRLASADFLEFTRQPFTVLGAIPEDWIYLAIVAGIGLVFALLALLRYRKRQLETAGDFLSFLPAKPVFLVIYTLAVGYLFYQIISGFPLLGLFAGLFIGFFTGKMLLERTVKVFQGWNFLFWGILVTAVFLSIGLTALDPLGATRYVPDADRVEAMYFYNSTDRYLYEDASEDENRWVITDTAEIAEFCQFHSEVCDGRYKNTEDGYTSVCLRYQLKNGKTVLRKYLIPVESPQGEFARQKLSSWQSVFHTSDWSNVTANTYQVDLEMNIGEQIVYTEITEPEQILGLMEAIRLDCEAGNMAQNWSFHDDENVPVWIYVYDSEYYTSIDGNQDMFTSDYVYEHIKVYDYNLNIFDSCTHALAYIESLDLDIEPYEK